MEALTRWRCMHLFSSLFNEIIITEWTIIRIPALSWLLLRLFSHTILPLRPPLFAILALNCRIDDNSMYIVHAHTIATEGFVSRRKLPINHFYALINKASVAHKPTHTNAHVAVGILFYKSLIWKLLSNKTHGWFKIAFEHGHGSENSIRVCVRVNLRFGFKLSLFPGILHWMLAREWYGT